MRVLFSPVSITSCLVLVAVSANAQVPIQGEIIVPRQNIFTLGTTVSVPDRGGASLGGFRSSSRRSSQTFPGLERGLGLSWTSREAEARVWIHDFQSMDPFWGGRGRNKAARPSGGFAGAMFQYSGNKREHGVTSSVVPGVVRNETGAKSTPRFDGSKRVIERARELESSGQFVASYNLWIEIRAKHMAAANSLELVNSLMRLKKRHEVQAAIKEPQAAQLLSRAKTLEQAGKPDAARLMYKAAARLLPARSAEIAGAKLIVRN